MLTDNTKAALSAEYEDIKNNTHKLSHSFVLGDEQRKEIEEQVVEELYRIFTHKAV